MQGRDAAPACDPPVFLFPLLQEREREEEEERGSSSSEEEEEDEEEKKRLKEAGLDSSSSDEDEDEEGEEEQEEEGAAGGRGRKRKEVDRGDAAAKRRKTGEAAAAAAAPPAPAAPVVRTGPFEVTAEEVLYVLRNLPPLQARHAAAASVEPGAPSRGPPCSALPDADGRVPADLWDPVQGREDGRAKDRLPEARAAHQVSRNSDSIRWVCTCA